MQMPDRSRRTVIALMAVIAGVVAIAAALVGGSDSSDPAATSTDRRSAIEPVAPIDPKDKDARDPGGGDEEAADPTDPFATSFGDKGPRKVTIRVSADGGVLVRVRYRGGKKTKQVAAGTFVETSMVRGGSPLAEVAFQIAGDANRGTCQIIVDGVEVASSTTNKPFGVAFCVG